MDGPFSTAVGLILAADAGLLQIIGLSLRVTLTAVLVACVVGLPLGAALALARFSGRGAVIVVFNALMGLPPVVAGLLVYLLLSRSGPLGDLALGQPAAPPKTSPGSDLWLLPPQPSVAGLIPAPAGSTDRTA